VQRQANLVGGDWYDVELIGRQLHVVIGDASGKGIAAAMMATVALSALRGERSRGASAQRAMETANKSLREATEPESFTTGIYLIVDVDSGEIRWMNMGHHSPFILRAFKDDGNAPRGYYLEGPRNRALGWFDDPGFGETVVQLEAGDRIVLFTDGFLESKSVEGEVFGEHRLAEAMIELAPLDDEAFAQELVADVERFAAGKLDDDLTLVMIEWVGVSTATDGGSRGLPRPDVSGPDVSGVQEWPSKR
jgi:phosphoserine phosphatase RsbU/P